MKIFAKTLVSFLAINIAIGTTTAADLLVEEFGVTPAYSSIGAAVTASVNGDRIIIKNRAGGIPWIENVTISKSLELLSYTDNDFFIVQGDYTIVPASGRKVTIIGMKNTAGDILDNGASSGTNNCTVNIVDSWLVNGYIDFDNASFNTTIVSTLIDDGWIEIRYGNIIGCDITNNSYSNQAIWVNNIVAFTGDTVNIVGNRVRSNVSSYAAIHWASTGQVANIRNNFARHYQMGIY